MMKKITVSIFIIFGFCANAQKPPLEVSFFSSYLTNNHKVEEYYGKPVGIYKELRLTKQITKHLKVGIFVAHQRHQAIEHLILPYQPPATPTLIDHTIDRDYLPLGLMTELNLTSFFTNHLKIFKSENNKWGIYTSVQFIYLHGRDTYNRTLSGNYLYRFAYADPSNRLLFSYPFANYGRKYLGYFFGIRHQTSKRLSFAIEAGSGALMYAQAGASLKIN